jgi:hypothetical protein
MPAAATRLAKARPVPSEAPAIIAHGPYLSARFTLHSPLSVSNCTQRRQSVEFDERSSVALGQYARNLVPLIAVSA